MSDTGHKRLAASQSEQWAMCPGSVRAKESLPEPARDHGSVWAMEGTAAHLLLERSLYDCKYPSDFMGRAIMIVEDGGASLLRRGAKPPADANWFPVDEEMVEAVDDCFFYVVRRLRELFPEQYDESHGEGDLDVIRDALNKERLRLERKVNPIPWRDDTGGTCDVSIDAWPVVLEVIDYKHGQGVVVEIDANWQLRNYGCGAAAEDGFDHERYIYTISQPRAAHAEGRIRTEEMTREEMQAFQTTLADEAAEVDEADAAWPGEPTEEWQLRFLKGGTHCKFCAFDPFCLAKQRQVEEMAAMEFAADPLDIDDGVFAEEDLELLGRKLLWIPVLDTWARKVEALAEKLALSGTRVPLHKVVRGKSPGRKFVQTITVHNPETGEDQEVDLTPEVLLEMCLSLGYFKDAEAANEAMYNPPGDPKLRTGLQIMKKLPKDVRGDFEEAFLHEQPGKLTLAPETDPRDEVEIDPGADFADEEV